MRGQTRSRAAVVDHGGLRVPHRFKRHSFIDAQRPDSVVGAEGFEPTNSSRLLL
jgi:hypothetical protein